MGNDQALKEFRRCCERCLRLGPAGPAHSRCARATGTILRSVCQCLGTACPAARICGIGQLPIELKSPRLAILMTGAEDTIWGAVWGTILDQYRLHQPHYHRLQSNHYERITDSIGTYCELFGAQIGAQISWTLPQLLAASNLARYMVN